MQSIAIDLGWAGWVFTSPTQRLKNHVWMFSATLIMSRRKRESIKAHLNQDIKPPFAVWRLPESSSDLCPQMGMWQMFLPNDIQNTETHAGLMQETSVWRQLWGPFCVKFKLLPHTHTHWRGERESLVIQRASFHGLHHHLCFGNEAQTCLPPRTNLLLRYKHGRLSRSTRILPQWKHLTREQLCSPRLPKATECHQHPMVALHGEVNKSPMASAMKNRSPLKTGQLKQLERENSIFNVNTFGFLVHRSSRVQFIHVKIRYPEVCQNPTDVTRAGSVRAKVSPHQADLLSFSDIKMQYWERTCLNSNPCSSVWEVRKEGRGEIR